MSEYEIALFLVIRNSKIIPELGMGTNMDEINELAYRTMQVVLKGINYEKAQKSYEQGKALTEKCYN